MMRTSHTTWIGSVCLVALFTGATPARAAKVSLADALRLAPLQADVDYDRPTAEQAEKCTITPNQGVAGWVVTNDSGQVLRRFLDTNKDDAVDQWCYFKNGIEVYRDIDANFNGKADQYRWMGTAGTRWGLDEDEDGRIDSWKAISPEEVTEEVVEALRTKDQARFKRVLLTAQELKGLGLVGEQATEITNRISTALEEFNDLKNRQKSIATNSEWIHFGGSRPGLIVAGASGNPKDILVYDNVSAVVATGTKHAQVTVGTLIRIGDGWRVIDVPRGLVEGDHDKLASGLFFQASLPTTTGLTVGATNIPETMQKLLTDLDNLEKEAQKSPSRKTYEQLADVLEKLAETAANEEDRGNWLRQFADRISGSVQEGAFPGGIDRLKNLVARLKKEEKSAELAAYVLFRQMSAQYGLDITQSDANVANVQSKWLDDLRTFVKDYPNVPDAADAMLQLAIAEEFAGHDAEAIKWYARIDSDFHTAPIAKKAAGAKRRLESVGKPLALTGLTTDGKRFDLSTLKGKPVVIHYWDTRCKPCKDDMKLLRDLQAKLAARSPVIVGVNLDDNPKDLAEFLRGNRIPWVQLYEKGGLESRLAVELGVFTLPTMLLIDRQGRVVHRNITAGELEAEIAKLK